MKFLSILLVAVSVSAVSCERHDFEGPDGTKQLHKKHGAYAIDQAKELESAAQGEAPAAH